MIAIIDYGMGNLRSVQKAFEYLGNHAVITDDVSVIQKADKVVLDRKSTRLNSSH